MVINHNDKTEMHNQRRSVGRRDYDSSNVVRLVVAAAAPHKETVAICEELLRLAKSGELPTLSYVGRAGNKTVKGAVGLNKSCRNTIRGALLALANEI